VAGFGSPATGNGSGTVTFPGRVNGAPQGSRLIDQQTKQYVIGASGRVLGMGAVPAKVQIAATTALNSSVVQGLGIDFSSASEGTSDVVNQLTAIFQNAFADLVQRKLMKINSVAVQKIGSDGAFVQVAWTDLTTGIEYRTSP
jgi:hypothetical protein